MQRTLRYIIVTITLLARQAAPANELPPEIAPLAARYLGEIEAINRGRDAAIVAAKAPYLWSLGKAENSATVHGDTQALEAVLDESHTLNSGDPLSPSPRLNLPFEIRSRRTCYLREVASIAQATALKLSRASSRYFRALGNLETKARHFGDEVLLKAVTSEKHRLIGQRTVALTSAVNLRSRLSLGGN